MIIRGVDTLEFGLDIAHYEKYVRPFLKTFKMLKEEGQNTGKTFDIDINGINLTIEKSGMPFYAYRLSCKDFIVGFTEKPMEDMPQIRVKLISGFLWSYGYKMAYEKFLEWLGYFNIDILGSRITRLDICVDTDEVRFTPNDVNCFVTRAKSKVKHFVSDEYAEGRKFSGITIGRGQPLLARVYNKSEEIKKTGKTWFEQIWKENGKNEISDIWRVEFQLRRKVLKELQISRVEDLWGKENNLWSYLTGEWLQLKKNTEENTSRSPVKRKWKIIQKVNNMVDISPLVREEVIKGNVRKLLDQASGLLFSIGAASNCNSIDQTLDLLKSYGEVKLGKEGIDFKRKVNDRRKRFLKEKLDSPI